MINKKLFIFKVEGMLMSLMNKSVFLMTKLYNKNIPVIPRAMQQMNRLIFATDIPRSVKIGEGTRFAHSGLGCVIHEKNDYWEKL